MVISEKHLRYLLNLFKRSTLDVAVLYLFGKTNSYLDVTYKSCFLVMSHGH